MLAATDLNIFDAMATWTPTTLRPGLPDAASKILCSQLPHLLSYALPLRHV